MCGVSYNAYAICGLEEDAVKFAYLLVVSKESCYINEK